MRKIREIRINKGFSGAELARIANIPQCSLFGYEIENIKKMSQERLERLATILECSIEEFDASVEEKPIIELKCLNENCWLNKKQYCTSPIVLADKAPCYGRNKVQKRIKEFDFTTRFLFRDRQ